VKKRNEMKKKNKKKQKLKYFSPVLREMGRGILVASG